MPGPNTVNLGNLGGITCDFYASVTSSIKGERVSQPTEHVPSLATFSRTSLSPTLFRRYFASTGTHFSHQLLGLVFVCFLIEFEDVYCILFLVEKCDIRLCTTTL